MPAAADNTPQTRLVIVSGPSGAGKSSVLKTLFERCDLPLAMSISATTRAPRPGEEDGTDYFFLSPEQFESRQNAGEFLESKEVFGRGHWYGTLREPVTSGLNAGKWVVLEIDVQGARTVLEQIHDAVTIFLHPGSMEELERRLRDRGTESIPSIRRRLEVAATEMQAISSYRHEVINQDIEQAADDICRLLSSYC